MSKKNLAPPLVIRVLRVGDLVITEKWTYVVVGEANRDRDREVFGFFFWDGEPPEYVNVKISRTLGQRMRVLG